MWVEKEVFSAALFRFNPRAHFFPFFFLLSSAVSWTDYLASCVMRAAHISKNSIVWWPAIGWLFATSLLLSAGGGGVSKSEDEKQNRLNIFSTRSLFSFLCLLTRSRPRQVLLAVLLAACDILVVGEALEVQEEALVVHLVELERHLHKVLPDGIPATHLDVVGIHNLPFLK